MGKVLRLEPGGNWLAVDANDLSALFWASLPTVPFVHLPWQIVLFMDMGGQQKDLSVSARVREGGRLVGPVVAVGRKGEGFVPLDADQEAWIRDWAEPVVGSRRSSQLFR